MKYFLRDILILCLIPVRWFMQIFFPMKEVCILLYHSISDSDDPLAIAPKDFEKQLRILRHVANPVPLSDIVGHINGQKNIPDRSVAVTFDDGYRDVITEALPLLKKYQVPATIFVSLGPSREELGNGHALLSSEEIKVLSREPLIEIGSHAVSHRKLTRLSEREVYDELSMSKTELERLMGTICRYLAYPKGSVNPTVRTLTMEAKYDAGMCVKQGMIQANGDPYLVKRVIVQQGIGPFAFRWRLTRIMDWLASFDRTIRT